MESLFFPQELPPAGQSKEYRFEALQYWPCFSYTETTSKFFKVCEVVLVPKPKLSDLKQN